MEVEPPVELVSDWAWSAAIRFCIKVWNAAAISEEEALVVELDEFVPAEAVVDDELVDELDASTPAAANALKIAPMSPPPAGGGLALDCAAPEALDSPVAP